MEEWKECKLKDICDYGKDRIEVSSLDNSNYISTENMLPNRAGITTATTLPTGEYTPSFEIDDTLVSNIRPYFKKIWKATFSGGCSADVLVFKAKENVSKEYLYYVLADDEFFKYSMATSKGTKMPRGDKTSILNYPVNLPPLPTQQKISAILSSLDDKIELNNKINTNLEQQAGALFKNWFVDFEPFGGKMPEGWKVGKLSDLITVKYGKDHKKLEDGNYPVYGSGGIMRKVDKYLYDKESVLIPRKGTLNNVFYINEPFWSVDTMFYTEMKKENIAKYVYFFVKGKDLNAMNAGSAVPSMTTEILNVIEVVIPSDEYLEKFENIVSPMFKHIKQCIIENENLASIRDTLLPKLMNGEIKI
ncbi:MAG: restriction endonuclease subunit S [Treponema porcinum]|uniref:restriction endonuclease subunit S n=1 Tax=Treponema porcinum TaxID=261392 RepID=UPI002A81C48F|nr:restriction endonuclease subunit S [Treponema porcinum]MDY5121618.1 restriction endonuclease subunit S [Treponema porcinum]